VDDEGIESRWSLEILGTRPDRPCAVGTGSLSRGKSGWGVALTTQPHLALRLKKE